MRLVGKIRLELNRAGGLQDLIVDETEHAFIQLDRVVLAVGENRERRLDLLLLLLNLRQIRLRERENQRNRLDLSSDDEPIRVRGVNDIAYVDLTNADHSIDRRRQPGVAELHLRGFDERLVRFYGALQLRYLRVLSLYQLRRRPAFISEVGVTSKISLGVHELGLIAIARGGDLIDLCLVGPRIDLCEQIAGMHGLPFGEVDAHDLSLDLAAYDYRVVGDDGADAGQIDRHVVRSDGSGHHRDRRRCCSSTRRRRPFEREFMRDGETTADRQDGDQQSGGNDNLASHLRPPVFEMPFSRSRKTLT